MPCTAPGSASSSRVICNDSKSSTAMTMTCGLPFRVTITRSWVAATSSAMAEKRVFTSLSGRIVIVRIIVDYNSDYKVSGTTHLGPATWGGLPPPRRCCSLSAGCGEGGVGPAQQRREVCLQLGQRRQVLPDQRLLISRLHGEPGVQQVGLGLAGHVGDRGGDLGLVRRGFPVVPLDLGRAGVVVEVPGHARRPGPD